MLVALYYATDGAHWEINTNWLSADPISEWYGVTTNPSGRFVLRLDLSENDLFGEIPPKLGDLFELQFLDLAENQLEGEIPSELGNLARLQFLDLAENQLEGEIPSELGNLARLQFLDLAENQLEGEIPSELGNLARLQFLDLAENQLEGEIPSELGNLARLQFLDLAENQLEGEIPPELGNLTSLEKLDLADNLLQGRIPHQLGGLPNLVSLLLGKNNKLNGCLPEGSTLPYCTAPEIVQVELEGKLISIRWNPVEGATHYNIYWHGGFGTSSCPGACELEATVPESPYVDEFRNTFWGPVYWLSACTNDGCPSPLVVYRGD